MFNKDMFCALKDLLNEMFSESVLTGKEGT